MRGTFQRVRHQGPEWGEYVAPPGRCSIEIAFPCICVSSDGVYRLDGTSFNQCGGQSCVKVSTRHKSGRAGERKKLVSRPVLVQGAADDSRIMDHALEPEVSI